MHLKVRLSQPGKKHLCGYHSSLAVATDAQLVLTVRAAGIKMLPCVQMLALGKQCTSPNLDSAGESDQFDQWEPCILSLSQRIKSHAAPLSLVPRAGGTQTWEVQQKLSAEVVMLAESGFRAIQLCTFWNIKHSSGERWGEVRGTSAIFFSSAHPYNRGRDFFC